jgi:hypothetical protein
MDRSQASNVFGGGLRPVRSSGDKDFEEYGYRKGTERQRQSKGDKAGGPRGLRHCCHS